MSNRLGQLNVSQLLRCRLCKVLNLLESMPLVVRREHFPLELLFICFEEFFNL